MPGIEEAARRAWEAEPAECREPGMQTIKYGTAGFRAKAAGMERVMYRAGVIAALRARLVGQSTGLVVTASHNPVADNGSKVVDGDGGMLSADWEGPATDIANAQSLDTLQAAFVALCPQGVVEEPNEGIVVVIGRDTRPHSPKLAGLVAQGVQSLGVSVLDLGLVTTPQVHWVVQKKNKGLAHSLSDYYAEHVSALAQLVAAKPLPSVTVDCACGVGALAVEALAAELKKQGVQMDLQIINGHDSETAQLNDKCGAEHVQKSRTFPVSVNVAEAAKSGQWFSSFDGDADRVVLFAAVEEQELELLDGDKILSLFCDFISSLLEQAKLELSLGAVQTALASSLSSPFPITPPRWPDSASASASLLNDSASASASLLNAGLGLQFETDRCGVCSYANGSSTLWIQNEAFAKSTGSKRELAMVATGVKHLHHKALDYDIGAYFEANGHGTVIFNDRARETIKVAAEQPDASQAAKLLHALAHLINPAIGDALSDMLAVVGVLVVKGWGLKEWAAIYKDKPSCMTKVLVKDRSYIKTTADETKVTSPSELQPKIDNQVAKVTGGRSFVRPSGTEDCVRVYAEAPTLEQARELAAKVGEEVTALLG